MLRDLFAERRRATALAGGRELDEAAAEGAELLRQLVAGLLVHDVAHHGRTVEVLLLIRAGSLLHALRRPPKAPACMASRGQRRNSACSQ